MAQDDAGEKTEQPTARRREEAREEGQIARSQDLTAAVSLVAGIMLLRFLGPGMFDNMLKMTAALGDVPDVTAGGLLPWMRRVGGLTMEIMGPFLALIVVLTALGTIAQSGLLLTWKRLALKPERLSPVEGVKKLFNLDSFTRLLTGLAKVGLVGFVAYLTIVARISDVLTTGVLHVGGVFARSSSLLFELALKMGLVLLVLGVIDYVYQRYRLEQKLRMTKQEIRDELKRMEGDPLLKHRRRQMQARLAMQRIRAEVPRADVVVTNPTHFSVALRYDEKNMSAPRVVAKGQDYLAFRIREIAQEHGVPVIERPPLARALYAGVDVGGEVPPHLYRAVAEVLAYVYQLSQRRAG